mgnify:CR=1 FL=1
MKRSISIEYKTGLTFGELAEFVDAGRAAGVAEQAPVGAQITFKRRLRQLTVDLFGPALCVGGRATAEDVRR